MFVGWTRQGGVAEAISDGVQMKWWRDGESVESVMPTRQSIAAKRYSQ